MNLEYKVNRPISLEQYLELLNSCSLGARRPIEDHECINGMITNSNLLVSAWRNEELIGVSRSVTDFNYSCYLSDLAVNEKYQKSGVGKRLIALTQEQLGPKCKIILISAPKAESYYEHLGFNKNPSCWVLDP